MNTLMILAIALAWLALLGISCLGWQLLRQNGRILLRLEELEKRLDEFEFGGHGEPAAQSTELNPGFRTPIAGNGDGRESRFNNRSLTRSKIKRDGLKAGTPAPDFRLPRLDGHGELALSELRGRQVLLVFSSPHCGPCNMLAPELEEFHHQHPELELVMISNGEPKENRAKVKEHGLTFPIVLQQRWEVSRRYAMFATPIGYLIDEAGVIQHDIAAGIDAIRELMFERALTAEGRPV